MSEKDELRGFGMNKPDDQQKAAKNGKNKNSDFSLGQTRNVSTGDETSDDVQARLNGTYNDIKSGINSANDARHTIKENRQKNTETSAKNPTEKKDSSDEKENSSENGKSKSSEENAGEAAEKSEKAGISVKDGAKNLAQKGAKTAVTSGKDAAVDKLRNFETGDESADEIVSDMNKSYDTLRDGYNLGKKSYDLMRRNSAAKTGGEAGKTAGDAAAGSGAESAVGEAAAEESAKAAAEEAIQNKASRKTLKTTVDGIKKAASGFGEKMLSSAVGLLGNPMTWIILLIILVLLFVLAIIFMNKNTKETALKNGEYVSEYQNEDHEDIMQTWMGVYYQKYSEMSVYAMVDTSGITEGNADVCENHGNNADVENAGGDSGIDACSGESFKDLTGVNLGDISQSELYQQGTVKWADLKIADTDNKEKYLGVSAGALSQLDQELNGNLLNTSQLIKPVYANCTENFEEFLKDEENDFDGDGKVTIKDCQIRNYDENGKPKEITPSEDSEDGAIKADESIPAWKDHTLYLSYAKSTAFDYEDADNAAAKLKETDNEDEKTESGNWDYGLGTMAHYVAVYQPSRINDYFVDDVQYICSEDGNSKGVTVPQCAGHKFGDVVVDKDPTHKGGVNTGPILGVYSDAYIPAHSLYYREWHTHAEKYNSKISQANNAIYNGSSGEYRIAGMPRDEWEFEPAVSTGVPQTEVKYVVDYALTFAGAVEFNISQKWVTESVAEHTQRIAYSDTKKDLAHVDEPFPQVGTNTGAVESFSATYCLYYDGVNKGCGYHTGSQLRWVAKGERQYETIEKYWDTEYKYNEETGKYDIPVQVEKEKTVVHDVAAHYENPGTGDMYRKGEIIGNASNEESLKAMGDDETVDNKDLYYWGSTVSAVIRIHKQGDLQTYAVQYNSQVPTVSKIVGLDYLSQYIRDYESFIPDRKDSSDEWKCYSTNPSISEEDAVNYEKASKVRSGTSVSSLKYTYKEGLEKYEGERKVFCYAGTDKDVVETLDLDHIPEVQFNSMAGRMGFRNDEETGEDEESAEYVPNQIKTNAGQSTDNQLMETLTKTDQYGNTVADIVSFFSGQYGVDSRLLAMIIAEENSTTGNVTGVEPGTYTAYNLSTRARMTEHMGGSYSSKDTQSLADTILNFFKGLFGSEKAGSVAVESGSKETLTVDRDDLEKGGMLIDNGGSLSFETIEEDEGEEEESEEGDPRLERAKIAYNFYKKAGYSNVQIAALLADFQANAGLKADYIEGRPVDSDSWNRDKLLEYSKTQRRSCVGIGLLKWTDERGIALLDYAEEKDISWKEMSLQLDYSINKDSDITLKDWKGEDVLAVNDAVAFLVNHVDKPENASAAIAKRIQYANDWYEKIAAGELDAEESELNISTINIDNSDYKWDPTDPMYGRNPTEGGDALLDKVPDDEFGKITEIKVYQINNAVVARNASGEEKVMVCSTGIDFDYSINYGGVHTITEDYMINRWHALNGNEYTPLAVRIHNDILFHSVPFKAKSRNSLEEGAYEKLGTAASHGCIRMALEDLCWLYKHVDVGVTTAEILNEEYDGDVPAYVTYDKAVISSDDSNETESQQSNPLGYLTPTHIERLSGAAISVKIAAMKLQGLQVKYEYNMPMVITAYGLGEDFVEAVLKVYERETGIDREMAVANTLDTAWADYRKEVYENASKYRVTLPSGRTYDYIEKLLSRLPAGGGIKYQKIDTRYMDENPEANVEVDASMHTIGTWYISESYDSLAASNNTLSRTNTANLIRAWRLLVKEGGQGTITEEQWKDLTMGLVEYPEGVYEINDPSSLYEKNIDYMHLKPNLSEDAIDEVISHMMTFGTDASYGEEDYVSSEFWQSHFSNMLGDGTVPWTSTLSAADLFGTESSGSPVNYYGLTDTGVLVVRPYGYMTDKYGDRDYSDSVTYQDLEKTSGKVFSPFNGKIAAIGESKEGYYVYIKLTPPNNRDDLMMMISGLSEVNVEEGDSTGPALGKSDENGMFNVAFMIDGEFIDYEDVVAAVMATADHDDEGVIGYVGTLAGDGDGFGGGSLTNNGIPNIIAPASLDGVTWKDLLGPSALHQPNQYAGHETWLNSGVYMVSGFGGDLPMPEGSPIYAVADGWIAVCDDAGGAQWGKANYMVYAFKGADNYYYTIMIWHIQNGSCSAFASGGGVRKKGEQIGAVGNTGISTGPHAHVFMNRMSSSYDPSNPNNIWTRLVCNGSTPQPCAVKMNAIFNW